MILILGGTTEGRKAVEVMEEAGSPFFYSTKTGEQNVALHHGTAMNGAMDYGQMCSFCREHGVRLLVDAAHPFASQLHDTVVRVSADLSIPAIRYERIYPPRDLSLTWIDGYDQLPPLKGVLLATTGVQSIARLRTFESDELGIIYRILNRDSSLRLAREQGARLDQLCFYESGEDERELLRRIRPDAVLMKESGTTGGFMEKCRAAKELGIKVIVIRRPKLSPAFHVVNGVHGLRRAVERFLPEFFPLHSGLTTGTYATAAAVAHAFLLLRGESPTQVPVLLPDGETINVDVNYADGYAWTRKVSGDDPDITNGIEIRAWVERSECFEVEGGKGVGTITLPGFDYPPGSPAINKGPRQMMEANLRQFGIPLKVTVEVPEGVEIARKTFNPRLGIEGGISIIGVSGIIMPYSEEAFLESIRKCMQVAQKSGNERVVINSGAKSEKFVRRCYPDLQEQAFVEYGNYIGETIKMAAEMGVKHLTLGIMMGKAVKLAAGHLDTHSRHTTMDRNFIARMLREAGCGDDTVGRAEHLNLAKELWTIVPADRIRDFCQVVLRHCRKHCKPLLPQGELTILLISEEGKIFEEA